MSTRITCRHPYHHRFSDAQHNPTVSPAADELQSGVSSGTALCVYPAYGEIFSTRGDRNIAEMLHKCPFADMGCTADPMSYEDLQQHLEIMHAHHHGMLLQLDQTTLLHPVLQRFIAVMPSDSEASPPLERSRCDSGFEEDESQYISADEGRHAYVSQWPMQCLLQQEFGQFNVDVTEQLQSLHEEIVSFHAQVTDPKPQCATKLVDSPNFRLASIESGKNNGCLIWKIERYTDKKKAAATSMVSMPFYSGRYGYKMCLRLYIMGDGIGKGTHLSLFFVVMRGEFDNILQWPFTHKVTFKLINQAEGMDIVDTFQPDPTSSSFRKPESDMNVARGCPLFVSHTELEGGGFLLDDMIFIKCEIDTSTMCHP